MIEKVKAITERIYPKLVEIRRDFHQHPELGLEEYRTSAQIKKYLAECGIEIEQLIGET
ncbi:MAG TPA: amidohydrolase, partial [Firmicutes bacterium]|nr:amidohydrolase [Bacillota bacterium]